MNENENVEKNKNENGIGKKIANLFRVRLSLFTVVIFLVIVMLVSLAVGNNLDIFNGKAKIVNEKYLLGEITKCSELTTAKLKFDGFQDFEGTGIKFLNRQDFKFTYTAHASIGINLSKVQVKVDQKNKVITVKLPKATILSLDIDENTIDYYDETFVLLPFNQKQDANNATSLCEKEAAKKLSEFNLGDFADRNAEAVIKNLLYQIAPGYTFEFKHI